LGQPLSPSHATEVACAEQVEVFDVGHAYFPFKIRLTSADASALVGSRPSDSASLLYMVFGFLLVKVMFICIVGPLSS
jgi:ABC-type thiamine transport system ATPase subunit